MTAIQDYLIRGTAMDHKVRAYAVLSTQLTNELSRRHQTTPTATAALGRTAAAGLMMGAMLKGEEKLTIQVKGGGPIGSIVVDANAKGEVRGYVDEPFTDLPLKSNGKLDVSGAVGMDGFLYITKDIGMKDPYRGSVPIVSGELAEDFTYYFAKSEQTPSAVSLGVLVGTDHTVIAAGGLIIQLMPGLSDQEITLIEEQLSQLPPITSLLSSGKTLEAIMAELLPSFRKMESMPVKFQCTCSKDRVEQTLISLGKEELQHIVEDGVGAEVHCHFCNELYNFGDEELQQLIIKI